jgi:hypothetical protein
MKMKTHKSNNRNEPCGFKTTFVPNPSNWVILCSGFLKGVNNTKVYSNIIGLDLTR